VSEGTRPQEAATRSRVRRRRIAFWSVVVVLLIPLPIGEGGLWMPILFVFFDWLNNFLPENF
jgi:hypothetical protein